MSAVRLDCAIGREVSLNPEHGIQRRRGLAMHRGRDVRVEVERNAHLAMAKQVRDDLGVDATR